MGGEEALRRRHIGDREGGESEELRGERGGPYLDHAQVRKVSSIR